jgi:hypothetical protein
MAVEAGTADYLALVHVVHELQVTEDVALHALEQQERADTRPRTPQFTGS